MSKFSEKDVINYAEGHMQPDEAQAFEEALGNDFALQADLKLYQSVTNTLQTEIAPDKTDIEFKATLNKFTQAHFKQKKSKPKAKIIAFSKIWYAAAILVIGLLVWAPWNKNLYNKYSETEMVSFAERGNNTQTDLLKATEAFNAEDYQQAKELLAPLVAKDTTNDMLRYYLGVAQLKSSTADDINIARQNLSIVAAKQSLLKHDAEFFIALSYLKEKNKKECKVWLNKIPKDADAYDKAQQLLKDL